MVMIKAEAEMRKGPWTEQEDLQLVRYVRLFGDRRWDFIAKVSGLNRTGKSCRLRWMNYLHPSLKRSRMTPQEQRLILELQSLWGNRWSWIASKLPGRTDNEIKNYWRTHMRKLARERKRSSSSGADEPSVADNYSLTPPQPGPESVAGGQESNCGCCSLAAELEESNVDDRVTSYSMNRIWSEIVDSSEVIGNPSDFSGPLVLTSSPMFWEGCAEPLWKMDDEEMARTLNIQSDHLVFNYYSGQELC